MWRRTYLLLILVRLYFALSPSYLHPDENFQGPEVIAGMSMLNSGIPNCFQLLGQPIIVPYELSRRFRNNIYVLKIYMGDTNDFMIHRPNLQLPSEVDLGVHLREPSSQRFSIMARLWPPHALAQMDMDREWK